MERPPSFEAQAAHHSACGFERCKDGPRHSVFSHPLQQRNRPWLDCNRASTGHVGYRRAGAWSRPTLAAQLFIFLPAVEFR